MFETNKKRIRQIVETALMAAVTVILSQISVSVGTIPFSLGLLGVMLCGSLLDPVRSLLSQAVYLALGMIGLPVFAGFKGGIQALIGPTGGFLLSYPLIALIISLFFRLSEKKGKNKVTGTLIVICGHIAGLAVCYSFGSIVYSIVTKTDILQALVICVLPFILFDAVKVAVSLIMSSLLRKRVLKN